jgi:hypothetical protein
MEFSLEGSLSIPYEDENGNRVNGLPKKKDKLNELGKQGWEAVAIYGSFNNQLLLKREITPGPDREQEQPKPVKKPERNPYLYYEPEL